MRNNKPAGVRQPSFIIKPKKTAIFLFYIAVIMLLLNLTGIFFQKILGYSNFTINAFVYFFDASKEDNIPTLFSTLILFIASDFLFLIYLIPDKQVQKNKKYWLLLSLIFLYLSVDEAISIHEQFNKVKSLMTSEMPGYNVNAPWILPYGFLVLVIGIFFIKFLFRLPVKTRKLFVISGIIYVSGAIGFEILEGEAVLAYAYGKEYYLLCAAEEFLEMSGVILFIYALLDYITLFKPLVQFMYMEKQPAKQEPEQETKAQSTSLFVEQPKNF